MRALIISPSLLCAFTAFGGIGTGGGTPPAMQDVLEQLMAKAPGDGGLFIEKDKLGLAVKGELNPELTISKLRSVPQSVRMSDMDFSTLSLNKGDIDAINVEGVSRSYKVEDGQTLDTLTLKDRRELIRDSVSKPLGN
ncbi:MAG TPA: hypothetical protein VFO10_18470 [Oligoflexus sp.]|uniref:hypothetical protein n=1 Tax=Oligoflexus sp. TaxID=1971216 RepID=UPI002D7EBD31|nr:hypothetical protein [Oligoflexus sp.]HET9239251.1 hypothetical protein [Oligoflexus sp.]